MQPNEPVETVIQRGEKILAAIAAKNAEAAAKPIPPGARISYMAPKDSAGVPITPK